MIDEASQRLTSGLALLLVLVGQRLRELHLDGTDGTNGTRADPPCFDNTNRYVDCGNGTVTDTVTGLIWLKQADCLANATYSAANQAAAGLKDGDCGGNLTDKSSTGDWRLPTKDEWSATIAKAVFSQTTGAASQRPRPC